MEQVRGLVHGDIAEERVQRGQPHVSRAHAVASLELQVVEELADEGGVELFERERAGLLTQVFRRESQQEPEAVAVAGDGVRAGASLREQPLGEEGVQQ